MQPQSLPDLPLQHNAALILCQRSRRAAVLCEGGGNLDGILGLAQVGKSELDCWPLGSARRTSL